MPSGRPRRERLQTYIWQRERSCGACRSCAGMREGIMGTRIAEHPILGVPEKGRLVSFTYDGKTLQGYEGEPVAMALKAAGVMVHRYTAKKHQPRGIFCAIGRCTDCVMVVDGVPNVRTCMTPLVEGMKVETQYGVTDIPFDDVDGKEGGAA